MLVCVRICDTEFDFIISRDVPESTNLCQRCCEKESENLQTWVRIDACMKGERRGRVMGAGREIDMSMCTYDTQTACKLRLGAYRKEHVERCQLLANHSKAPQVSQ